MANQIDGTCSRHSRPELVKPNGLGLRDWGDTSTYPVRCVLPNSLCSHALHVLSVQAGLGSDRASCIADRKARKTRNDGTFRRRARVCVCVYGHADTPIVPLSLTTQTPLTEATADKQ